MKQGNSKAKGGEFERKMCKRLSLWISDNQRDDLVWRTAMSGGRASVKFKKGSKNLTQTGDICSIDPLSAPYTNKFLFECKAYKDLDVANLLYCTNRQGILGIWYEEVRKGMNHKKIPFILGRQNNKKELIFTWDSFHLFLLEQNYKIEVKGCFPQHGMVVYGMEEFFDEIDPTVSLGFNKEFYLEGKSW